MVPANSILAQARESPVSAVELKMVIAVFTAMPLPAYLCMQNLCSKIRLSYMQAMKPRHANLVAGKLADVFM